MKVKYVNYWFFLLIVSLIFCNVPKAICLELLGGESGNKLSIYVLMLGWIFVIAEKLRNRNEIRYSEVKIELKYKPLVIFLLVYLLSQIGALIINVANYPYYDLLVSNTHMLPARFMQLLSLGTICNLSSQDGIQIYMFFKEIKNLIVNSFWTFGGAGLIYYGYMSASKLQQPNQLVKKCIEVLLAGVLVSSTLILIYALIELPFLLGEDWAKYLLTKCNPYIHQIGAYNNIYLGSNIDGEKAFSWWPPLLWPAQVRSLFPEPSFFGMYCSFLMPWLWYAFIADIRKNWGNKLVLFYILLLSVLIFLTKSRTAILLFLGENTLLLIYVVYCAKKEIFKKIITVLFIGAAAWSCSIWFIGMETNINDRQLNSSSVSYKEKADMYIEENITSASSENKRSNKARFSLMQTEINLWKDYPLLGVGRGMKSAYIVDYLPKTALEDQEVRMWVRRINENGPLKAGFPDVSEYTMRLCEMGLIGFFIYLFPFIYLVVYFTKYLYINRQKGKMNEYIYQVVYFYLISLIGLLVGGLSTSLNATYCLWVLLGVGGIIKNNVDC